MAERVIGTVAELWRYPVKSMQGERLDAAEVSRRGITGDRAYALVDAETGRLVSAKRPRQWGGLMHHSAQLVDPDADPPVVRMTLADGTTCTTGPGAVEALSASLGRPVRMVSAAPQGSVMEEIWPEEKGESLYGPVVGNEDGDALITVPPALGAPPGTLFDFSAIHLVTSTSLRSLAAAHPDGPVDVRRFRPNLVIDTDDAGLAPFPENEWVETSLRVGSSLVLEGLMLTMRCVMVTLSQPGLDRDRGVLRATAAANRVDVPGVGAYPCLGLYARVTGEGPVHLGDRVALVEP